jgi:uncharacterized membrane protein
MKITRIITTFSLLLTLELGASFPKVEITSGESVEFSVRLRWWGDEDRNFDLKITGPKDWLAKAKPSYEDTWISAIRLEPGKTEYPETIKIVAASPPWLILVPGEYMITVEASSGQIRETLELTVIITAQYAIDMVPVTERYNMVASGGQDNYFQLQIQNNGTAAVDKITFSSFKPDDWTIDFSPAGIFSLGAEDFQTVDVNIKPPPKTIAGDYSITLRASGEQTSADSIKVRVTVETPTIWGWVGVAIIVLVIAGLAFVIMRFSRR